MTALMNPLRQFEIPKRNARCFYREETFHPGMDVYTLLCQKEGEPFSRRDFCHVCWQERGPLESSLPEAKGYWKSHIEPKKPPGESSKADKAMALLKELIASSDSSVDEVYILCLFLARAKRLALRKELQKEEISYQVYEILGQEECFAVQVVTLSPPQVVMIQESIAAKLKGNS